jgi:uncharacterized protein YdeI (YjbR/CyaY-like superfamily)
MAAVPPELLLPDAAAWRRWLRRNAGRATGVRLVLAKKGHIEPTSLTYGQALDEALCEGWIDGQIGRRDEASYFQRFTPRRARSAWSAKNVENVERLTKEGRMRERGLEEVRRAEQDGRYAAAYAGPATIEVPDDLRRALDGEPAAREMFEVLTSQNRYAVLWRIHNARRSDTRARRIEQFVSMLARGETIYPQRRRPGA